LPTEKNQKTPRSPVPISNRETLRLKIDGKLRALLADADCDFLLFQVVSPGNVTHVAGFGKLLV
jgi:hypothetical protein